MPAPIAPRPTPTPTRSGVTPPSGGGAPTAPSGAPPPSPQLPQAAVPSAPIAPTVQPINQNSISNRPALPSQQLATKLDQFGQPYYGEGFQGFARQAYSNIFGSQNFAGAPSTQKGQTAVAKNVTDVGGALQTINWDGWGKSLFGISAQDVQKSVGAISSEMYANREKVVGQGPENPLQTAQVLAPTESTLVKNYLGEVAKQGMAALSAIDWGWKRLVGTGEAAGSFNTDPSKSVSAPQDNFVSGTVKDIMQAVFPILSTQLQTAKDVSTVLGGNPEVDRGFWQTLARIPGNYADLVINAFTGAAQAGMEIGQGKLQPGEVVSREVQFIQGSDAAYTMMDSKAAELSYQQRFAQGESPGFIAQDIQHPMSELIGSLTDPAMYLGMDIPGPGKTAITLPFIGDVKIGGVQQFVPWKTMFTIPTFGEIFGIGSRSAALVSEGDRFFTAVPHITDAAGVLANPTELNAVENFTKAATTASKDVQSWYKDYSITALTSDGKANILARDAKGLYQTLVMSTRDPERVMSLMNDATTVLRGTNDTEKSLAMARLMSDPSGKYMLSQAGLQTMELTARMSESGILERIVNKAGGDPGVLATDIVKTLSGITHDLIPSVDEMAQASKDAKDAGVLSKVQQLGNDLASGKIDQIAHDKQLASLVKGTAISSKDAQLAQKFDQLPWYIKGTRAATHAYEKAIFNAIAGGMGKLYIGWNIAFPIRKVLGQSVAILNDMGLKDAAEITTEALASGGLIAGQKITDSLVARNIEESKNLLGFQHEATTRGFSSSGFMGKTKDEFAARMANNSELVTSGDIAVRTISHELDKAIASGVNPDASAYGLSQEQKALWDKRILETHGNSDQVANEIRKVSGQKFIEAQKMVQLPPNMDRFLSDVRQKDTALGILNTATSQADAETKLRQLFTSIEQAGYKGASLEDAALSHDVPQGMVESFYDGSKAASEGVVDANAGDNFARMTQAFQNMRSELEAGSTKLGQEIYSQLSQAGMTDQRTQFQNMLIEAKQAEQSTYQPTNQIRNAVMGEGGLFNRSKAGEDIAKLWNEARIDTGTQHGTWSLKDIYPNVNPGQLSRGEFHNMLIQSFLDFNAGAWRTSNLNYYDSTYNALKFGADSLGQPLESMVLPSGEQGSNFFQRAAQMRTQAEDINNTLYGQRVFRQALRNTPMETTLASAPAELVRDKTAVFEAVNATRAGKGLQPYGSMADVPRNEWVAQVANPKVVSLQTQATLLENRMMSPTTPKEEIPALQQQLQTMGEQLHPSIAGRGSAAEDALLKQNQEALASAGIKTPALPGAPTGGNIDLAQRGSQAEADLIKSNQAALDEFLNPTKKLPGPPPYAGNSTTARAVYENTNDPGYLKDREALIQSVKNAWGTKIPTGSLDQKTEEALTALKTEFDSRLNPLKPKISAIATAKRDFIMNDYNKTYLERAVAYGAPFSYFHIEASTKMGQRFVDNPKLIIDYLAYRKYMTQIHAGLPDFYKYNVSVSNLPGMDAQSPFFLNLENVINPIHALTNIPFNDPYKRADWLSTTVDNLNQMSGGGMMTPLNWAVGLHLYQQGKDDAGSRWMGQLFPQATGIKAGLTEAQKLTGTGPINAGPLIQNNQVDPFTNFLDKGLTPYERDQVGSALAQMVKDGQITQEQALDAAHDQNSPIWSQASVLASQNAAPGQLSGFFLGVGFKARSPQDVINNAMNTQIGQLMNMKDNLSPQDYQKAWQELGAKYPSMDVVLLSHKGGAQRDSAFAYNVLARIPPGNVTSMLKIAGLNQDDINRFYNSKGFTTAAGYTDSSGNVHAPAPFTSAEQQKFMAAITDMSAILKIPGQGTQQEWLATKDAYKQANAQIAGQLGTDIWDKVTAYYNLKDTNPDQAAVFKQMHPEVDAALNARQGLIIQNPLLAKYYGGIDTIESYFDGRNREALLQKYGADILAKQQAYYNEMDPAKRRAVLAKYPELKQYWKDSHAMVDSTNQAIVNFAQYLPKQEQLQTRTDLTNPNAAQTAMTKALQPQGPPKWQDISKGMSPSLQQEVVNYWMNNGKLNPNSTKELDYLAQKQGFYNGNELLRMAGIAIQGVGQPQP
jgi:hypothetical protein